jgi:predicted O-linked N-acetylglucosamine transferase (SPINDLY family)
MGDTSEALLTRATELLGADCIADAAALCRELLERDPGVAAAHNLLGVAAARGGEPMAAENHFARAAALEPDRGEFHRNLGFVRRQLGRLDEASASLERAVALDGGDIVALHELGRIRQAQGQIAEAADCYRRVIDREPGNALVLLTYGNALVALGRLPEAADVLARARAADPDSLDARFAHAGALSGLGRPVDALAVYREIEQRQDDYPGLHVNMGFELKRLGHCAEAIRHYDRAIALNPQESTAYSNRGNALCGQQRMQEAAASFRRALEIDPDYAAARSNLLLTLNYTERSQEVLYKESLVYEERHAAALLPAACVHTNSRAPDRRLRVGYVSGDFRRHSVAYFIRGVLAAHDPTRVETFCFANVKHADAMTAELRSLAGHWREIAGIDDAAVARRIREDAIDILVDLSGHTGASRLLVFARKPAPVQVTWLGYPNTTGMRTMDYRITDDIADPAGTADALHTEKLVRLRDGFLCYQPDELPQIAAPTGGSVTFGSFNTLAKLTPEVAATWSAILRGVPGSRLVLKSESLDEADTRQRFIAMFAANGIGPERLDLLPPVEDHRAHLATYSRIDIALDPFPYNGTTTTCEALCAGVPVIALRGSRHASRVGASILHHAGLVDWVAESEADYVALAAARAADPPGLRALRPAIRAAVRASPMLDPARFTAGLESAYRRLWTDWCTGGR